MKPYAPALGMALACLASLGLSACNRPATDLTSVSLMERAASPHGHLAMSAEDALLTSQVKLALVATEGINGEDILVTARQGKVTLVGSVPSGQIPLAEEVARNVDGVRSVYNKLKPVGIMV